MGAVEAAAEALAAGDPDLGPAQLEHAVVALEHVDPALLQHGDELVAAVDVPVVVAEHGEHRHVDALNGGGDHRALLRLAVRREVAGQQNEVHPPAQPGERLRPALLVALRPRWMSPVAAIRIAHSSRGSLPAVLSERMAMRRTVPG